MDLWKTWRRPVSIALSLLSGNTRTPTKERRGGSAIDVTRLATDVSASGVLLDDWPGGSYSLRDWSDRSKPELHSCPVDSILLQFRGSQEDEVTTNSSFVHDEHFDGNWFVGNIARCASYTVRRGISKADLTFPLTTGFIDQARRSR